MEELTTLVLADEASVHAVAMRVFDHGKASEVLDHCAERLRVQRAEIIELRELVNDYGATLGARVKVENEMWQMLAEKRAMPDKDDIKDWALRLGVPATLVERFNKRAAK
jgi:hypothetical protein